MIRAIVARLRDEIAEVQQASLEALVNLAKFGKLVHWVMIYTH